MLLLTPLMLCASVTTPWDAGLQSGDWRQRQQALLGAAAARHAKPTSAAAAAGPLLPCVVPVATPPLPSPLPAEIQAAVAQVEKGLDKTFSDSGATGGVAVLVYGDQVLTTYGYGTTRKSTAAASATAPPACAAELAELCNSTSALPCELCVGHDQHALRLAGCTSADVQNFCDSRNNKPTGDSIFRIGSISKVFTDLMLHRLDEEGGDVNLFTPITQLAPEYRPAWPAGIKPSPKGGSLRDLGSHKAGLARYAPCNFGDCNITLETALERIANWTLLFEPGSNNLAYSNTGFGLLGRLLERHSEEPWESMLTTLAGILGMSSTSGTTPQGAAAKERVAYGYQGAQQLPLQELGFSNPAGGIYSKWPLS